MADSVEFAHSVSTFGVGNGATLSNEGESIDIDRGIYLKDAVTLFAETEIFADGTNFMVPPGIFAHPSRAAWRNARLERSWRHPAESQAPTSSARPSHQAEI